MSKAIDENNLYCVKSEERCKITKALTLFKLVSYLESEKELKEVYRINIE
jgi:hypothetical protein